MLGKLLGALELNDLSAFASRSLLSMLPPSAVWQQGQRLVTNMRDVDAFQRAKASRAAELLRSDLAVALQPQHHDGTTPPRDPHNYAHTLVTLYFHQVFTDCPVLLDLRSGSVSDVPSVSPLLSWTPAPWFVAWDEEFRRALRNVYLGFYVDDRALFRTALAQLGLAGAEEPFRNHFGTDPSRTRFELRRFIDSFKAIFEHCKAHDIELRPDFITLGLYLSSLYENLDRLGVVVDARACLLRAVERLPDGESGSVSLPRARQEYNGPGDGVQGDGGHGNGVQRDKAQGDNGSHGN